MTSKTVRKQTRKRRKRAFSPEYIQQFSKDMDEIKTRSQLLVSSYRPDSPEYKRINEAVREALNKYPLRGFIKWIGVGWLKSHDGDLLYLKLKLKPPKREAWNVKKTVHEQLFFSIYEVEGLKSQWRNPIILALRQIRRYLSADHQNVLSRLTRQQMMARQLDFKAYSIDRGVRQTLDKMAFNQANATLPSSTPRRLDALCRALRLGLKQRMKLRVLRDLLEDDGAYRFDEAWDWFETSSYNGNLHELETAVTSQVHAIDQLCLEILDNMSKLAKLPFKTDLDDMELDFTWFSLATTLPRGRAFVHSFGQEDAVGKTIGRLEYTAMRSVWGADLFAEEMGTLSTVENHEEVRKIAEKFLDMELIIEQSTGNDGLASKAITAEREAGCMTSVEAEEAWGWVRDNKRALLKVRLETLTAFHQRLETESKADDETEGDDQEKRLRLPEYLEEMIAASTDGEAVELPEPKPLRDRLAELGEKHNPLDYTQLAPLVALYKEIDQALKTVGSGAFQAKYIGGELDITTPPEELPWQRAQRENERDAQMNRRTDRLLSTEEELGKLSECAKQLILATYQGSKFFSMPKEFETAKESLMKGLPSVAYDDFKQAFAIYLDDMLLRLKRLDYSPIQVAPFRKIFLEVQNTEPQAKLFHLDRLLQELHAIPMTQQLIEALDDWKDDLRASSFSNKLSVIQESGDALQKLVTEVVEELNGAIASAEFVPKHLYFEVAGLGDCYSPNLQDLLDGLERLAPRLATDKAGESLIGDIESLEARIIEAQVQCAKNGEAHTKLQQLAQTEGMGKMVEVMGKLIGKNYKQLGKLLTGVNRVLKRVTELRNRFGGNYETAHLQYTIEAEDLDTLKRTYDFVPNISMMDVKRFAMAYMHREKLITKLIQDVIKGEVNVPKEIARQIDAQVLNSFQNEKKISREFKQAMLVNSAEILQAEGSQLRYTLNFVIKQEALRKAIVEGLMDVLREIKKEQHLKTLIDLPFWANLKVILNDYEPRTHNAVYKNNLSSFLQRASKL